MKIKRLLPVTLILALGLFASCSKDMDEVNPGLAQSASADAKPVEATLALTFTPTPVLVNSTATVKATITPKPTDGEMQLYKAVDAMGNPTTAALAADWVAVVKTAVPSTGFITYNFSSGATGMYGFQARYVPKGGSGYLAKAVSGDIEVVANCSGMTLNGSLAKTGQSGDVYTFTATYIVDACSDVLGAKLQGGLTAGVNFNNLVSPATNDIRTTGGDSKTNYTIAWSLGDLAGNSGTKTYTVTFSKELKGAGVHTLTGDWSVKGKSADGNDVIAEFPGLTYTIE